MAHSPLEPQEMGGLGSHFTRWCRRKARAIQKAIPGPVRLRAERERANILVKKKREENGTSQCHDPSKQNIPTPRTTRSMEDPGRPSSLPFPLSFLPAPSFTDQTLTTYTVTEYPNSVSLKILTFLPVLFCFTFQQRPLKTSVN